MIFRLSDQYKVTFNLVGGKDQTTFLWVKNWVKNYFVPFKVEETSLWFDDKSLTCRKINDFYDYY